MIIGKKSMNIDKKRKLIDIKIEAKVRIKKIKSACSLFIFFFDEISSVHVDMINSNPNHHQHDDDDNDILNKQFMVKKKPTGIFISLSFNEIH